MSRCVVTSWPAPACPSRWVLCSALCYLCASVCIGVTSWFIAWRQAGLHQPVGSGGVLASHCPAQARCPACRTRAFWLPAAMPASMPRPPPNLGPLPHQHATPASHTQTSAPGAVVRFPIVTATVSQPGATFPHPDRATPTASSSWRGLACPCCCWVSATAAATPHFVGRSGCACSCRMCGLAHAHSAAGRA